MKTFFAARPVLLAALLLAVIPASNAQFRVASTTPAASREAVYAGTYLLPNGTTLTVETDARGVAVEAYDLRSQAALGVVEVAALRYETALAAFLPALLAEDQSVLLAAVPATLRPEAARSFARLRDIVTREIGGYAGYELEGATRRADGKVEGFATVVGTEGRVALRAVWDADGLVTLTQGAVLPQRFEALPIARHRFVVPQPEGDAPTWIEFSVRPDGAVSALTLRSDVGTLTAQRQQTTASL